MNELKYSHELYEHKGKILHATKEFLGYDPLISIPLAWPSLPMEGEVKREFSFIIGNEVFRAVLSAGKFWGPLRGYSQVEIYRGEDQIISTKSGGHGHGSNFSNGQKHFIDGGRAYMVIKGSAMTNFETDSNYLALDLDPSNCYLLIFEGITIPVKYPRNEFKTALKKERYFRQDLEPLRQKMWQGTLQLPDGILRVESSEVPGYSMRSFDGVTTLYGDGGWKNSSCLGKKEFSINGNRYVY